MRKFLQASVAACLALGAVTAGAQVNMTFVNAGGHNDGHYYVGTYTGSANGTNIPLNCVDFFHEVAPPANWVANFTSLDGDLTNTRFGNLGRSDYQKMAYLSTFYAAAMSANDNQQIVAIQHAIWSFYYPSIPPDLTSQNRWAYIANEIAHPPTTLTNHDTDFWRQQAGFAPTANAYYAHFQIVTDVNVSTAGYPQGNTVQEFITTPEPSSMALLGTGLIGLVPMVRRRRK